MMKWSYSERAGNRHLELVHRYSDAVSELDCGEVGKGYGQGRDEEWDHRRPGQARRRLRFCSARD